MGPRFPGSRPLVPLGLGALIVLAAAIRPGSSQGPSRLNILLVTIDTLRADRVGAYGYAGARTPTMDRLAAGGVRFTDATAHAPLTFPSHVAILTGQYPGALGIRLNGLGRVPPEASTLAERLKPAGYRTGAVVSSVILSRTSGLAQGFDEYDDRIPAQVRETVALADLQRPANAVTSAARAWLANQAGPWFLWVHYYDPHLPYAAPARYAALTPGRPYDAEVAFADAQLGLLLQGIDAARTAIVVTSDHGEALGDHGEPDHGFFLYDSTLHVPLIIRAPGFPPRVVREQVRSLDLAATVAELAGLAPASSNDRDAAQSLVPLMRGNGRAEVPVSLAESWYPRLHFGWSELRSARVGEWKFVESPRPELYDLRTDPAEARDLAADRGPVAARLAGDLARITARFTAAPEAVPAHPDEQTQERLRALGYVSTFAPLASGTRGDDPKDHVAEYRQYRALFSRALSLLETGAAEESAVLLRRLVRLNVRAFEAHLYLGNAYAARGRIDPALGEYDVASQLNPMLATPHFEAAKALAAKGDYAAAAARCRTGLQLEPESYYGYYTLGVVFQKAGNPAEAARAFSRAVEINGLEPRARANLASAAMRLNDLDLARAQFEQLIVLKHQVAPAQFNLGVIAARHGDSAEAARRYRLALEADPSFSAAREALAKLRPGVRR